MYRPTFSLIVLLLFCHHVAPSQGIEIDTILQEYSWLRIKCTCSNGISIDETERDGIRIDHSGSTGKRINSVVKEGQIALNTDDADRFLVITDRPAIIGNHKVEFNDSFTQNVSFLGQVLIRIIGPVASGDWIIPIAEHNGTAKAVATSDLDFNDMIIGQAWETNQSYEEKLVNIIVGVDQSKALHTSLKSLSTKYDIQNKKMLKQ